MLLRGLVFLCWFFSAVTCQAQAAPAGAIEISVGSNNTKRGIVPGGGLDESQRFRDCPNCPQMVVAPAGSFMMGSPWDLDGDERPQHKVTFAKPFAIGEGPITAGEWNACAADGGCGGYRMPKELSDDAAAILISWHDAHAYVEWLSKKTGKHYRLPSEAEWEYAARAGTTTYIWWGGDTLPKPELDRVTVEKALLPNPWGLRLVVGTLRQWVEDCKSDYDILTLQNYAGAPTDGSAWLRNCSDRRVVRGFRSSSYRETVNADQRVNLLVPTFRVVRDLP